MEIAYIIISIILLIIAILLFVKRSKNIGGLTLDEFNRLKSENEELKIRQSANEERIGNLKEDKIAFIQHLKEERANSEQKLQERINKLEGEKNQHLEKLSLERQSLSQIEEAYKAQKERLADQERFIKETQTKFSKDFEIIAAQILKQKTAEFTEVNRTNLDILLNPLKENIKAFEDKVEKVYKSESDERHVLKGEISKLMELNRQISDEAHNLTRALKGENKKQGNWGEMVLDKLLEGSGLIEGVNYSRQNSFAIQNGNRQQPDVVIHLPDDKHLVIDAKVSLVAYERLVSATEEDDLKSLLTLHVNSVKNHITGLSGKNYHDLYQINSPEYVLLFVPIESSYAVAVQHDQNLFDFAWSKRVVVVTPSTLLATLKTVASIWKQEQQTRNAMDIATKAGQLYDKFVGFVNDLRKVGDSLDKSQKAYGDAMNKLTTGHGNLVTRVETLRKLGAKTNKEIDSEFLEE